MAGIANAVKSMGLRTLEKLAPVMKVRSLLNMLARKLNCVHLAGIQV